ncbi:MAG: hypothetical protein IPI32_09635 [Austwickia sp.]|nr:hypothetical protein [Austwickia sp.]MBK8436241.1 hypothetical protein [Austwickia sp.]MBK9101919.1 hypothetical protein [Austwickia sp.]
MSDADEPRPPVRRVGPRRVRWQPGLTEPEQYQDSRGELPEQDRARADQGDDGEEWLRAQRPPHWE